MFGRHGFGGGVGRGMFGGRFFERGDIKYVVLDLLREKPRHGYELIQAIEDRCGGMYAPSPGAIYPTLQMLEDQGYVSVEARDGKKTYTITDAGREFLEEKSQTVRDIWDRLEGRWGPRVHGEWHDIKDELRDLKEEFRGVARMMSGRTRSATDPEKIRRIREVVTRTRREIEDILREEPVTRA